MQTAGLKQITVPLRTNIALARSWADLEILCERIDAAYRRGDLDLESAEALSAFAAATASSVPSEMSAESLVDKSLFDKKVQCSCCGSADLWHNGAQITCAICHPDPVSVMGSRQAA